MKAEFETINLDDVQEVEMFLTSYKTTRGIRLANLLGIPGKGRARIASSLSNYAWNKSTAIDCRKAGRIAEALQYEAICERIYPTLPDQYRW